MKITIEKVCNGYILDIYESSVQHRRMVSGFEKNLNLEADEKALISAFNIIQEVFEVPFS
jgi:hypothetical protein